MMLETDRRREAWLFRAEIYHWFTARDKHAHLQEAKALIQKLA
jgi:hypothetical protein